MFDIGMGGGPEPHHVLLKHSKLQINGQYHWFMKPRKEILNAFKTFNSIVKHRLQRTYTSCMNLPHSRKDI
jgi:hypothetical protein